MRFRCTGMALLRSCALRYCANRQGDRWRDIVKGTRAVYTGLLTEAAMPPAAGSPPEVREEQLCRK